MEAQLVRSTLSVLGRNALSAIGYVGETTRPGLSRSVRDKTLIGLASKGHGLEAICAFLGLLQVDLLARICALNLTTPHNGSVRRKNGNRNAWQLGEIRQLIELWEENFSSTSIAAKFGRSPGSVRAKARWLGLPRRPRRDIITGIPPVTLSRENATYGFPAPKRKRRRWDRDIYERVIERFLSYQHYKGIARDLKLTPAQVRSKIQATGLPADRERHLQSMDFQPDTPHAIALRAGFIQRVCPELGQVYVTPRKNRRQYCPAYYKTEQYRHRAALGSENCSVSHLC